MTIGAGQGEVGRENRVLRELVAVYRHLSGLALQDAEVATVARLIAERAGATVAVVSPAMDILAAGLAEERVPVLLAVFPLRSDEEAEYLANEVPDLIVPDAALQAMARAGANGALTGLQLASELVRQARPWSTGSWCACRATPPTPWTTCSAPSDACRPTRLWLRHNRPLSKLVAPPGACRPARGPQ